MEAFFAALCLFTPVVAVVGIAVGYFIWSSRGFSLEGAVAEASADMDGRFELTTSAAGPLDVYAAYDLLAASRSGGGISYGAVLRMDVTRDTPAGRFEQRAEYLIGQAVRPSGEVPVAEALSAGPVRRSGKRIRRALLIARVPAGETLAVGGRIQPTGNAECLGLHLFVKPKA